MSWQAALFGLVKKYGSAAKFAASTVLGAVLPGSPAVIDLIGDAIETARDNAQNEWEDKLMVSAKVSAEELERLGSVVEVLTGELGTLVAQVAELDGMPEAAERILRVSLSTDTGLQKALSRLADLAGCFDVLALQNRKLLAGQEEMLPLMKRMAGVADFLEQLRGAGLDPAGLREQLQQIQKGLAALSRGQAAEAEPVLQKLAQNQPGCAAAQVALATVEILEHHMPAAERALTRAARLRPADRELAEIQRRVTRSLGPEATPPSAGPSLSTRLARIPNLGDLLDGWRLDDRLGSGGWGQVFRASQAGQVRALKVMHPELAGDRSFVERFRREIMTLCSLPRHAHLAALQDFGKDDGTGCWYLLMEYVDGPTLEQRLERGGPLELDEGVRLFAAVADGLAAAHQRGIVHRDFKPGNILLRQPAAEPVLVDFGLATAAERPGVTRAGESAGYTAMFAAPEQLRGRPVDARTDVYCLAASLYYALCYTDADAREPDQFEPQRVPEQVRQVLTLALDPRPPKRPADAGALRDALKAALAPPAPQQQGGRAGGRFWTQSQTPAPPPTPPPASAKRGAASSIEIMLSGVLYTRSMDRPQAAWARQVVTPATMTVQPGQAYFLEAARTVRDDDLACLTAFDGMPQLQGIALKECHRVSDAGLAILANLTQLTELRLKDCTKVSDHGLAHLANLVQLQRLILWGCDQISDRGLLHLRGLPDLRELTLVGCEQITDVGLVHLHGLVQLDSLDLTDCTQITSAGVASLRRTLPRCSITQ